jgi:cysteinyl-tRNA synthetase
MIESRLGLPVDIHGGGHDLIFPHHENENAQGRCATGGGPYARYWMHNGFLDMAGEKMSKSLGNVRLVRELLERHPGEVLRWALLKGHYRSPLDFTDSLLEQSAKELDYLYGVLRRLPRLGAPPVGGAASGLEPLLDDLNTPAAMGRLHALAHALETGAPDQDRHRAELEALAEILGVLQQDPDAWFERGAGDLRGRIESLVRTRDEARRAKDWPAADRLREALDALNVVVMDGPDGAVWRIKER